MRFTRASIYALSAVTHLATQKDNPATPSHEVARAHQIPERFLLKVLKPLVGIGVLRSIKGPNGGYKLAKTADKISVLEILEAVEGPIQTQLPGLENGNRALEARLGKLSETMVIHQRDQLRRLTIKELARL